MKRLRALCVPFCLLMLSGGCVVRAMGQEGTVPSKIEGREVRLSAKTREVLERAGAAYHALTSYQDVTEVEMVFDVRGADGTSVRMPSHRLTRFAYAGARRYTLRNESFAVYCHDRTFTNQIRHGRDDQGKSIEDKELTKLAADGPVDWADCMGNLAQSLSPTAPQSLLMTGPGAGLELFLEADGVETGELDERPGVWVTGKGICPYTFGDSGGGKDIVPIRAWFSAKSGLLREVRYDISRTSWALSAAEGYGERHGGNGTVNAYVRVRMTDVQVNVPMDDSLFVYSPDAPSGGRFERDSMPAMGMGGKKSPAMAPAGMSPAKPASNAAPGMPAAMTPATPINAGPGETITSGETLRNKLLDLPAPAFATKSPEEKAIALADFKGKVVMLDFWATWCGPCMQAIPAVQRLSEQFKDKDVAIVGVNRDKAEDLAKVKRTIERKQLTFHQAMDTDGAIAKQYKISAIPALILIDKQGVVRQVHVGYGPEEEKILAAEIEKLLKGEKLDPQ